MHASWDILPDYRHCNYAIYWGVNNGHATGHAAMVSARLVAEAMERGMKLVVFDPMCNYSAAKATEWVPIIPGTDGAVLLAMCNVILNELAIWDAEYLKTKTNGPYLVGPDGRIREGRRYGQAPCLGRGSVESLPYTTTRPSPTMPWKATTRSEARSCRPSFELLKKHLLAYTPEMASEVSQVPAGDYTEDRRRSTPRPQTWAALSSSTATGFPSDPSRPSRSGAAKVTATPSTRPWPSCLLSHILGAADVPGGTVGLPAGRSASRRRESLRSAPARDRTACLPRPSGSPPTRRGPYKEPQMPGDLGLLELFTPLLRLARLGPADPEELWRRRWACPTASRCSSISAAIRSWG